MKKLLALLVSSIMVCGGGISVCAEPQLSTPIEGEFTEYYKYTSKVYNSMTISNKTASCKSTVMGFSDKTTKVVVTHTLEKKSGKWWSNVTSWTKTFNTYTAIYTTSKSSLHTVLKQSQRSITVLIMRPLRFIVAQCHAENTI